ncbi:sigma factor-like helix-turn-helix DNA-binding protein [Longirhabdus pacifica]|uniref:sigma factor-like helix-turn-helix DNA-binding protein n=1 Tax=Longirhabdus pacifica TaxID=2305227 RepID=UPI0010092EBC|nr:sigma factor-like helix-turn-helix DNA-binding protein [Longirhabdus pacifica]
MIEIEECRIFLRRTAWKLQYRSRVQRNKESFLFQDYFTSQPGFENDLVLKLHVEELLESISSHRGKYILIRLFYEQATEKEIASELNISQQAVSKWKKKILQSIQMKTI